VCIYLFRWNSITWLNKSHSTNFHRSLGNKDY